MKKPTPRARRLKKHREFAEIYVKEAKGQLRITEELMRSITSPKWKVEIAKAAITNKLVPLEGYYKPGLGGTLYRFKDHDHYLTWAGLHYESRRRRREAARITIELRGRLDKIKKQEKAAIIIYRGSVATLMISGFWNFSIPLVIGAVVGIIAGHVSWKLRQWITKDNEII